MLAGPICQWSATKFSLAYHAFYVIRLRGIKFLVKSDQVLNSRDCLSEFVMQRLGEIRDWSLVLNWLKSRQVRQSSKVLFFCTWWELLLVWNRYSVCYCFIPPCRRINVCLLFFSLVIVKQAEDIQLVSMDSAEPASLWMESNMEDSSGLDLICARNSLSKGLLSETNTIK